MISPGCCGSFFHKSCVDALIKSGNISCPNCRAVFPGHHISTSHCRAEFPAQRTSTSHCRAEFRGQPTSTSQVLPATPNLAERIETALTDAFSLAKQNGKLNEGSSHKSKYIYIYDKVSGFIVEIGDAFVLPEFLELCSMKDRLINVKAFTNVVGSPGRRWLPPEHADKLGFCNEVEQSIQTAFGSTKPPLRSKTYIDLFS